MNLVVRMRNPVFWAQIAAVVAAQIMAYFKLTGADFTTWGMVWETLCNAVANPYVVVSVVVAVWGVLNDPTTKGVGDSERAKTYIVPSK